jgi:hypothetical protein
VSLKRIFLIALIAGTADYVSPAETVTAEQLVTSVLQRFSHSSELAPTETAVKLMFPVSERQRLIRIEQPRGHDLRWTSRDERCFVIFAIDGDHASSTWGKCVTNSKRRRDSTLTGWEQALPPLEATELPSRSKTLIQTFVRGTDTAVDLSMEPQGKKWVVGFGLRSGVPRH